MKVRFLRNPALEHGLTDQYGQLWHVQVMPHIYELEAIGSAIRIVGNGKQSNEITQETLSLLASENVLELIE